MAENQLWAYKKIHYFQLSVISQLILAIVILGLLASPRFVLAQESYPEPTDQVVNDYANLLTPTDKANIHKLFSDLKQETGVEAVVVTINSIKDYKTTDKTIESFATNLFNVWEIGNSTKNYGVLILVAVKDRTVRIEVGAGYGNNQDANMQEVINEHMLPSFRNGQYSQGIYRGTRAVVGKLTGKWPEELTVSTPAATAYLSQLRPIAENTKGVWWATVVGLVVFASGGILGAKKYLRYRKRKCPQCQTDMKRLDEISDDVYLNSGQKMEEILNSVDYDVWQCPNCNYHRLFRYPSLFSSLKTCPTCNYRTVRVSRVTLSTPTYTSTGSEQITRKCQQCNYYDEDVVILPMLTREEQDDGDFGSSSWSSSSSSGGHSSGGGASGNW